MPSAVFVLAIDIVTESLLQASAQIGLFALESGIRPIVVERHSLAYLHSENEVITPPFSGTAGSDDPIANFGDSANGRLTSGQSAKAKKWIWSKAVVAGYHIRVQLQARIP